MKNNDALAVSEEHFIGDSMQEIIDRKTKAIRERNKEKARRELIGQIRTQYCKLARQWYGYEQDDIKALSLEEKRSLGAMLKRKAVRRSQAFHTIFLSLTASSAGAGILFPFMYILTFSASVFYGVFGWISHSLEQDMTTFIRHEKDIYDNNEWFKNESGHFVFDI